MDESPNVHLSIGEASETDDTRHSNANHRPMRALDEQQSGYIRVVVITLLLVALGFVVYDSLADRIVESTILEFLAWVELHPRKGMLAVICVYILATILFVPGSILTFGTGYAFGSAYNNKVEGVAVASTVRMKCSFVI